MQLKENRASGMHTQAQVGATTQQYDSEIRTYRTGKSSL